MILDRVTLTGADDSVADPGQLIELSERFPFVEWGILVSESSRGNQRFPSRLWMDRLCQAAAGKSLNLSVHVCGAWVRHICGGGWGPMIKWVGPLLEISGRVQLNFHSYLHLISPSFVSVALEQQERHGWQIIFQVDGVNDHLASNAFDDGLDCCPLYDKSGGAGVSPDEWPLPMKGMYCGYAGGMGPDNVVRELQRIRGVTGEDDRVWIDMESKLYTGGQFDLVKCRQVLESVEGFVTEAG